jgi:hypothetical protein
MNLTRIFSRILCIALCTFGLAASPLAGAASLDARPMVKVDSRANYKAVYDIHTPETAAGISKGLYYARGPIDDTYQQVLGDPFAVNLNGKIVQDFLNLGVHVEICHSVMKAKGWTPDDVLPGVTIVHDGYTRLIKLQNDGYAYIGGF